MSFFLFWSDAPRNTPDAIFGSSLRIWMDATNPAGRTLDTSGSETYSALANLAAGFTGESISNATKGTQPTSATDSGTGYKAINGSGSQFLLGSITAISGDFFTWMIYRTPATYTANRQLIALSNSGALNQQWFNAPLGALPYTSTFTGANFHGAWHPSNYRNHTNTIAAGTMVSTTAFFPQANGANLTLWRDNGDAQTFANSAARGNIDRIGFGTTIGSLIAAGTTFFEFGLVTGSPDATARARLHSYLRSKYAGLA